MLREERFGRRRLGREVIAVIRSRYERLDSSRILTFNLELELKLTDVDPCQVLHWILDTAPHAVSVGVLAVELGLLPHRLEPEGLARKGEAGIHGRDDRE